jgi:exosortase D (VPLPA-CTERM-specific)
MQTITDNERYIWKFSATSWVFIFFTLALLAMTFHAGIREMIKIWDTREEYSYGYLIPFITAFLIWQRRDILEKTNFTGSWLGIAIILAGWALFVLASLIAFSTAIQIAMLIVLCGILLSIMGWEGFKPIFIPVCFLAFMIPLPGFFLLNLSAQLQLLSSTLGVDVIRLFGISVYLEGNVIDLGSFKLQVVDACSGLRYLFPLMSLTFISVYFFKGAFWKKVVIFLSSVPITVLMNSFRIGVIGMLVEYGGPSQAEGFLHYFEGWVVFMACLSIIVAEIWIFTKLGKHKQTLREAFNLELPPPPDKDAVARIRPLPKQYMAVVPLLIATTLSSYLLATRVEAKPPRTEFSSFPLVLGNWHGKQEFLDKIYLDALKLDDYFLANYTNDGRDLVNFYVAYYATQRAGESAHSPRTCIPGGGWEIKSLAPHAVSGVTFAGKQLVVNRLVIQKGDSKQLVYYWFQQRGRIITNEYKVKWYLLKDELTRNRSDGALVRVTAVLDANTDINEADKRLADFTRSVSSVLSKYVPE